MSADIADRALGPRAAKLKAKGDLAELAFLYKAASLGFGVAKPYGDKERYDFILDSGERFWRVQVRSTSYAEAGRRGYKVSTAHNDRGRKVRDLPGRGDRLFRGLHRFTRGLVHNPG